MHIIDLNTVRLDICQIDSIFIAVNRREKNMYNELEYAHLLGNLVHN